MQQEFLWYSSFLSNGLDEARGTLLDSFIIRSIKFLKYLTDIDPLWNGFSFDLYGHGLLFTDYFWSELWRSGAFDSNAMSRYEDKVLLYMEKEK